MAVNHIVRPKDISATANDAGRFEVEKLMAIS